MGVLLKKRFLSLVLTIIILVSFIINTFYRAFFIRVFDGKIENSINISLIIFPLLVTMFSIIIPLQKDKIYGVSHTEFRRLRLNSILDFLYATILSFVLLILCIIFFECKLYLSFLVSTFLLSAWFLYFVCEELPLITNNQYFINKIINKNILTEEGLEFDIKSLINEIIKYSLFTKGLEETFINFSSKSSDKDKEKVLNKVLNVQEEMLRTLLDLNGNGIEEYVRDKYNLNILDFVNILKANTILLVTENLQLDDESHVLSVKAIRTIFGLRKLLEKTVSNDSSKEIISEIIRKMFNKAQKVKEYRPHFYRIVNALLVGTVTEDETWFIEILHEKVFSRYLYYSDDETLFFHISLYLYWYVKIDKNENHKNIEAFLEKGGYIDNKNTYIDSWKNNYFDFYKQGNFSINVLKEIYDSREGHDWNKTIYNRIVSRHLDKEFSFEFVIEWWIKYLLQTYESVYKKFEIKNLDIKNLEKQVVSVLEKQIFEKDKLKENLTFDIDYYFIQGKFCNYYSSDSKLVSYFKDVISSNNLQDLMNQNQNVTEESIKGLVSRIFETLKINFKEAFGYDDKIELEDVKMEYYEFYIDSDFPDTTYRLIVKYIEETMYKNIEEYFSESITKDSKDKTQALSSNYIDEILDSDSYSISRALKRFLLDSNIKDDLEKKKKIEKLEEIPSYLSQNMLIVMKKDAYKINFMIDEDLTIKSIRKFNEDEINEKIENECSKVKDDLYYYYCNKSNKWAIMDKNQLFKLFYDKYIIFEIYTKYKIELKPESIFLISGQCQEFCVNEMN